jgi:hypothetical protein
MEVHAGVWEMNWISVKERTPKNGEQVLVFGYLETELQDKAKKQTIGLVEWQDRYSSNCYDMCYYHMDYHDITHWCEIPKEPCIEDKEIEE